MIASLETTLPIQIAFSNAREGQPIWAATPVEERLKCIRRLRYLIAGQATRVAASAGGSVAEALASQVLPLADACRFLERNASNILAKRRLGRRGRALWLHGVASEIERDPSGVVLIIAPSNYPLFLPGVQLVQALTAGNSVLLKPGYGGEAAAVMLQSLCRGAGIDERIVGVLPATDDAAQAALRLPIDKVFFTGSSNVGKQVLTELAWRVVPIVVELSGCDAAIIRADADLPLVARALAFGLSFNQGATCIAPRRVLVARTGLEQLEAELSVRIPSQPSEGDVPYLTNALHQAHAAGAAPLIGGFSPDGLLNLPCILTDVRPDMEVANLETFAPVLSLIATDSDDEAIAIANNSRFALGASIFSRDERAAQELARRIHAGVVTINDLIVPTADARVPFGGRKESGFGVTRGAEGLLEMTRPKVIQVRRGNRRFHSDLSLINQSTAFLANLIAATHARGITRRIAACARLLLRDRKYGPDQQ